MKILIFHTLLASSILLMLTACNDKAAPSTPNTASSPATASVTTDAWIGKWNGPEGTFIDISGSNGNYVITIQDLDSPKQFQGKSNGNEISFERNGTTEALQSTDGVGTGMKWLAGKSDCIRVSSGEGWCRD